MTFALSAAIWWLVLPSLSLAQSVVNSLAKPAPAPPQEAHSPRAPVTDYAPVTPPAANVPTVVSPEQDKIAQALALLPGETNEDYTKRMKVRYEAAMQNLDRLGAEHQARMKALIRQP